MRTAPEVRELARQQSTESLLRGMHLRSAALSAPVRVHGLREMQGKEISQRMPFRIVLEGGQGVFACICDAGWTVICPKSEARVTFGKHVEDARSPSAG